MMAKLPADSEDLTGQEAEAAELETAAAAPARAEDAGEEDDGDAEEEREQQEEEPDLPEELGAMLVAPGWHYDSRRRPVLVVDDAWAMRTPTPRHSGDAWPSEALGRCGRVGGRSWRTMSSGAAWFRPTGFYDRLRRNWSCASRRRATRMEPKILTRRAQETR